MPCLPPDVVLGARTLLGAAEGHRGRAQRQRLRRLGRLATVANGSGRVEAAAAVRWRAR
jgi:hypothetical protein